MGLLSTVADQVLGDSDSEDAEGNVETFRYRCAQCDSTFERKKTRMVGISCPECGSRDVRAAD